MGNARSRLSWSGMGSTRPSRTGQHTGWYLSRQNPLCAGYEVRVASVHLFSGTGSCPSRLGGFGWNEYFTSAGPLQQLAIMFQRTAVILLLLFSCRALAYTAFDTNCSVPSLAVNYVSAPDTRGTLEILWSCLFTIVACTWTVHHLNVPRQRETFNRGKRGTIKWLIHTSRVSVKWFLITMIAPEILLSNLFANMGGFVMRRFVPERTGSLQDTRPSVQQETQEIEENPDQNDTSTFNENAKVPGHDVTIEQDTNVGDPSHDVENPYHLNARDILHLRKTGILTRLPYFSEEELRDRSKTDPFVRVITVGQILWGVHVPVTILEYGGDGKAALDELSKANKVEVAPAIWTDLLVGIENMIGSSKRKMGAPIQSSFNRNNLESWGEYGIILGAVAFGAVHLAAWNFAFPTRVELILWRSAALYCTGCMPAFLFLVYLDDMVAAIRRWIMTLVQWLRRGSKTESRARPSAAAKDESSLTMEDF
ncbi:hypothetical protein BO71DRAFT_443866 [Aspergillus ellipticus CBS 707.79]|uniref:Uncharacterized protein n=1 Tax=Aspergillus ellipticus CBS 707.79 TaxID=1448320 RepID=A0A319D0E6_9EURO|nr:hypothetical protein BO71DRAFT_443866 [Aspergillus ellipticus CBS 707.79]